MVYITDVRPGLLFPTGPMRTVKYYHIFADFVKNSAFADLDKHFGNQSAVSCVSDEAETSTPE